MALDLVHDGVDASGSDNTLNVLWGEVGNANSADFAGGQLVHSCVVTLATRTRLGKVASKRTFPGLDKSDRVVNVSFVAICGDGGQLVVRGLLKRDGPVHKVKLTMSLARSRKKHFNSTLTSR